MALNCGIVGLPNVGKSTIFQALTSAPAEAENYPFCTIDANVGVVPVPDGRLYRLADHVSTERVIPTTVEFVDIAGLVAGASKGEGLGNQFLARIRETGVIVHVVRCFEDPDVIHVSNQVDPVSDIETVNIELALADLDTVERRLERNKRDLRSQERDTAKRAGQLQPVLERLQELLSQGKPARLLHLSDDEAELVRELHLITRKKQLYLCNVDEDSAATGNEYVEQVRRFVEEQNREALSMDDGHERAGDVLVLSGRLEAEIAQLETVEERDAFLEEVGLEQSGLNRLIHTGYELLGLRTFFTLGPKEIRAWTFKLGERAPEAAGRIHSDFQRGFIRAEVYHCEELFAYGSEQKLREAGKIRLEGKAYRVQDGDCLNVKFNV
jgi:hypothetical protein